MPEEEAQERSQGVVWCCSYSRLRVVAVGSAVQRSQAPEGKTSADFPGLKAQR